MMEVYWISGSPYAWRVLLALEFKQAPYTARLLEASKEQHKTPEYLALNPRGKVPALRDGDVVLPESLAILAYLDRKLPEPPLFGRSAADAGRIWKVISDSAYYLEPAGRRIAVPLLFAGVGDKANDIREAAELVHGEFRAFARALETRRWLATDSPSAADIAVYPFVELLLRAAGKDAAKPLDLGFLPFARTYPAIAAWQDRIRALPGYDKTYPPHWRQPPLAAAS